MTDKLWKAARAIIAQNLPGSVRLVHILKLSRKAAGPNADGYGAKFTREEDMFLRVLAVRAAVGGKVPLSLFDNDFFKIYLRHLNAKHRGPHRLERNRIIEVMMDIAMLEFKKIVDERREELVNAFLSNLNQLVQKANS